MRDLLKTRLLNKKAVKKYQKSNPWLRNLTLMRARCNNKNSFGYKYYGGRGIKALLTIDEIKQLWARDNAGLLKHPSLDRIDSDGDYTFNNCRFIEWSENSRKGSGKLYKIICVCGKSSMRHRIYAKYCSLECCLKYSARNTYLKNREERLVYANKYWETYKEKRNKYRRERNRLAAQDRVAA